MYRRVFCSIVTNMLAGGVVSAEGLNSEQVSSMNIQNGFEMSEV